MVPFIRPCPIRDCAGMVQVEACSAYARFDVRDSDSLGIMRNHGYHTHVMPPETKPSHLACAQLTTRIKAAPDAKPLKLKVRSALGYIVIPNNSIQTQSTMSFADWDCIKPNQPTGGYS